MALVYTILTFHDPGIQYERYSFMWGVDVVLADSPRSLIPFA